MDPVSMQTCSPAEHVGTTKEADMGMGKVSRTSLFFLSGAIGAGVCGCSAQPNTEEIGDVGIEHAKLQSNEQPPNADRPFNHCDGDARCRADKYCDANGICLPRKAQGRACEPFAEADCLTDGCRVCATGNCVDGFCCDSTCDQGCAACAGALTGALNGTCAPVPAGTDPKDACEQDGAYPDSCGADGQCDGAGACRSVATEGTRCGDLSCVGNSVSDFACNATGECVETTLTCGGPDVFIEIGAGNYFTCARRANGHIECWGSNGAYFGLPADQAFAQLSAGDDHVCALNLDGSVACWGQFGEFPPPETFSEIAAGGFHTCGLRPDDTVACWGGDSTASTEPPGVFDELASGSLHACGLRFDGSVECWGENWNGQTNTPSGAFTSVCGGYFQSCGVRTDGSVECWGDVSWLEDWAPPPSGSFAEVFCGGFFACALTAEGAIACWGQNPSGAREPPSGPFESMSLGISHGCGLRPDGSIACWGSNDSGEADPPG
jgi:alpha-tubulin suppressor-like RCC1 family protein